MNRRRKRRRRWVLFIILLLAVTLIGVYLLIRQRLAPIVESIAVKQVENVVSEAINDAIHEEILSGSVDYDRMIYFEKDLDGQITALKTNMGEVNRLKTEILNLVDEKVGVLETRKLEIPLGSVLIPTLLSGRGPGIGVRVLAASNSDADFTNQFSQAGINQTLHQIQLQVNVTVSILLPIDSVETVVTAQVVVAETVLVGDVPGTFATINTPGE